MAYRRNTRRKASSARVGRKSYARSRRTVARRPVRRRRAAPRKTARRAAAPRAIRIEIVQAPAQGVSAHTQALLDQRKVVAPKRARF